MGTTFPEEDCKLHEWPRWEAKVPRRLLLGYLRGVVRNLCGSIWLLPQRDFQGHQRQYHHHRGRWHIWWQYPAQELHPLGRRDVHAFIGNVCNVRVSHKEVPEVYGLWSDHLCVATVCCRSHCDVLRWCGYCLSYAADTHGSLPRHHVLLLQETSQDCYRHGQGYWYIPHLKAYRLRGAVGHEYHLNPHLYAMGRIGYWADSAQLGSTTTTSRRNIPIPIYHPNLQLHLLHVLFVLRDGIPNRQFCSYLVLPVQKEYAGKRNQVAVPSSHWLHHLWSPHHYDHQDDANDGQGAEIQQCRHPNLPSHLYLPPISDREIR